MEGFRVTLVRKEASMLRLHRILLACALGVIAGSPVEGQAPVISEFLAASDESTLYDEDGRISLLQNPQLPRSPKFRLSLVWLIPLPSFPSSLR